METSFNFSALRHFLSFAEDAVSKGHLDQDFFKPVDASSYLSLLMEEHGNAAAVMKLLKSLDGTLSQLKLLVEEGMAIAYKTLLPGIYGRGINSLPVEVISRIFELLSDDKGWKNLSLTCHYFRGIAIKIPKLWTAVTSNKDPSCSLWRSGSRGIDITFKHDRNNEHAGRFFKLLDLYQHRWRSLSIDAMDSCFLDDPSSSLNGFLHTLRKQYEGRTFPALESLKVDYGTENVPGDQDEDGRIEVPTNEEDPNAFLRSFFSEWEMPALRSIEAREFIPMLPPSCHSNITCFRLTLSGYGSGDPTVHNLQGLSRCLHTFHALETFAVEMCCIYELLPSEGILVELPRLKVAEFRLENSNNDAIQFLFDVFSAPNLETLSLCAEMNGDCLSDFFNLLFPSDAPRWPVLRTLSCSLELTEPGEDPEAPFNIMCTRLPRLHHLTIGTGGLGQPKELRLHNYYKEPDWSPQPPLRTLRLENCRQFNTFFIVDLAKIVNSPDFEMLEILDCPNIRVELVREMVPASMKYDCYPAEWRGKVHRFRSTKLGNPDRGVAYARDSQVEIGL